MKVNISGNFHVLKEESRGNTLDRRPFFLVTALQPTPYLLLGSLQPNVCGMCRGVPPGLAIHGNSHMSQVFEQVSCLKNTRSQMQKVR